MKYINVVHLVDTEGPLYEPLNITFNRIKEVFGINIKANKLNLKKILENDISLDLNKKLKKKFFESFNERTLNYKKNWNEVNNQNKILFSKKFRAKYQDSYGQNWKINWNCVDHINYKSNPQRKTLGYHKIFDYYKDKILKSGIKDSIHFHFHPTSISNGSNTTGNHYFSNSDNLFQILCRRIIDRNWFPSVYRPGFHIENPDSNWFLEQFIPFDYSNQSCSQINTNTERFENWEYASKSWSPYHPDHDDYQKKGSCRRWVARCLNVGTRIALLNQSEVDKAFDERGRNKKVILAFTNHDFRSMEHDFKNTYQMLLNSSKKYKIRFKFSDAREAFQSLLGKPKKKIKFKVNFVDNKIFIKSNKKIFGPQPFLAIKTKDKNYYHENFYIKKPFKEWIYSFDRHSVEKNKIDYFAFAANDSYGCTALVKIKLSNSKFKIKTYNL